MKLKGVFSGFAKTDYEQYTQNKECHHNEPFASTCYHAQQYAEKSLKDAISACGGSFSPTHNLTKLVRNLSLLTNTDMTDSEYNDIMRRSSFLTRLYDDSRYPNTHGRDRTFTVDDAETATDDAEIIARWAESLVDGFMMTSGSPRSVADTRHSRSIPLHMREDRHLDIRIGETRR